MTRFDYYRQGVALQEAFYAECPIPSSGPDSATAELAQRDTRLLQAHQAYRHAITLCQEEGAYRDQAFARRKLGQIYWTQNRLAEALVELQTALSILDSLPELSRDELGEESAVRFYLGRIAHVQGRTAEAIACFERCVRLDTILYHVADAVTSMENLKLVAPNHPMETYATAFPDTPSAFAPSTPTPEKAPGPRLWGASPSARNIALLGTEPVALAAMARAVEGGVMVDAKARGNPMSILLRYLFLALGLSPERGLPPRTVTCDLTAADPDQMHRAIRRSTAVLIIFQRRQFFLPCFQTAIQDIVQIMKRRDVFRAFIAAPEAEMEWLKLQAAAGEPLANHILENIHLHPDQSEDGLLQAINCYTCGIRQARWENRWRSWANAWTGLFSGLAQITVTLAPILVILTATALLFRQELTRPFVAPYSELLCWMMGLNVCVFQAPVFYVAGRAFGRTLKGSGVSYSFLPSPAAFGGNRLFVWMFLFLAIFIPGQWVGRVLDPPTSWFSLGFVSGLILEAWRRQRPVFLSPTRLLTRSALTRLRQWQWWTIQGLPPSPWRCPLFAPLGRAIFISYSRASEWGGNLAHTLQKRLSEAGAEVYLDTICLEAGGNWRRQLLRAITRSRVFVSLVDPLTVQREWTNSETEAALYAWFQRCAPQIVLLLKPDSPLPPVGSGIMKPAFDLLLSSPQTQGLGGVRITQASSLTPVIFEEAFRTHRFGNTVSVFPKVLSMLLGLLNSLVTALTRLLVYYGPIYAGLQLHWRHIHGTLPAQPLWELLGCAFLLGFSGRELMNLTANILAGAQFSDFRASHIGRIRCLLKHLNPLSWALVLALQFPLTAPLTLGWEAIFLVLGWSSCSIWINFKLSQPVNGGKLQPW